MEILHRASVRRSEGHKSLAQGVALNDSRGRRQCNDQTRKMADKNLKKNKLKMVSNELKNRTYRRTWKRNKEVTEKRRPGKGEHHENKLKHRKKKK